MSTPAHGLSATVEIRAPLPPAYRELLAPEALEFLALLERQFGGRRQELLAGRAAREAEFDAGRAAGLPARDPGGARRRLDGGRAAGRDSPTGEVEITGPVDRKMIINALNSGASVFMADFEDSNCADLGQRASRARSTCATPCDAHDRVHRARERQALPARTTKTAVLIVRPRGWHLPEKHVAGRRRADARARSSTSASTSSTTRETLLAQRHRPVLLPAEAGEPPRGAALERRLRAARRTRLGIPRGTITRDGADRDASSPPSRWTRSSTSCASTRPGSTAAAGTTSSASSRSSRSRPGLRAARPRRW
ncbi:MAG: hypothetical protein MZW92_51125 [Comamonadaceae bacterium]|nr:hypothetical protein [Comamonadaceae bacterium]